MPCNRPCAASSRRNPDTLHGIFGDAQWTNKDRLSDALLKDLIEHYEDGARETREDPASFDLITFAHYEPRQVLGVDVAKPGSKKIGPPSWKALDRATVEALVGGPV